MEASACGSGPSMLSLPGSGPFALSIRALQEEPQPVSNLVDLTGAAICRVRGWLRYGRSIKLLCSSEWEARPRGGTPTPFYSFGDKPDAKRPARLPRAVIDKRSRVAKRRRAENLKLIHALASNAGTYQVAA